jgi:uncharacterized protein YecE (DUF72 family)
MPQRIDLSRTHLRIGPAGWSYADWSGYVYPTPRPKGFHEATYLAQFFDTIEINTSFYGPLRPDSATQWLERVAANPRFVFTAKLWQKFTHEPFAKAERAVAAEARREILRSTQSDKSAAATEAQRVHRPATVHHPERSPRSEGSLRNPATAISGSLPKISLEDEKLVRAGFDVLRSANKLAAVLLQFPFSFHRDAETHAYLASLLARFSEYPLAVEVRHASWNDPAFFDLLRKHNAAFCNIDQPVIGRSLEPSALVTAPFAYVRLHGRRYDTWFNDDTDLPQHERYNYLYSAQELAPWRDRIANVASSARETYVVTNNHYLGKAVVNALELIHLLTGNKLAVPESLRQHYPQLDAIASTPRANPTLF